MTKRSFACHGCRKLKIKCDLARPRCEYCGARDKPCIYPSDDEPLPPPSELLLVKSVSHLPQPQLVVLSLNAPSRQTGLSLQEQELLNFLLYRIEVHYAPQRDTEPICAVFSYQFPALFMESPMTRKVSLAYGQMRLLGCYPDRLDRLLSHDGAIVERDVLSIVEGFLATLSYVQQLVDEVATLDWSHAATTLRVLELAVSNLYVFEFLTVHPHRLVPLVLFTGELDYMSFIKGVREFFATFAPVLMNTRMALFYRPPVLANTPIIHPWCALLLEDIRVGEPDAGVRDLLGRVVLMMLAIVATAQAMNSLIPLYQWVMIQSLGGFMKLVYAKHMLALRVLYTYACYAFEYRMYVLAYANIWYEYIEWFHQYNLDTFGSWVYPDDESKLNTVRIWQAQFPTTT